MRGKAESGDKTMVDAWTPAVDAADAAAGNGSDAAAVLAAAAEAARAGAVATEPLVARKGRASYLGERSAGHRDPGAESTALLLEAAADTAAVSAGA
jgi:dihydroxyacetone kinase-like protein